MNLRIWIGTWPKAEGTHIQTRRESNGGGIWHERYTVYSSSCTVSEVMLRATIVQAARWQHWLETSTSCESSELLSVFVSLRHSSIVFLRCGFNTTWWWSVTFRIWFFYNWSNVLSCFSGYINHLASGLFTYSFMVCGIYCRVYPSQDNAIDYMQYFLLPTSRELLVGYNIPCCKNIWWTILIGAQLGTVR